VNGFLARFGGRCGLCDGPILEGDEVEYVEGELCHSACADAEVFDDEDAR
jgi:hypothetical protein